MYHGRKRSQRRELTEEEIAKAKTRVEYLRAKSKAANEAIDVAGVSKTTIGK